MKASDVFRRAGDISRERGWHQGWFYDRQLDTGAVCVLGACHVAVSGIADSHAAVPFLELLDVAIDAEPRGGRAFWNDAPGRTHAEVLQALDAAYVLALQEEGVDVSGTDWEEL